MNKTETSRLIAYLHNVGWSDKDISDFLLWIKTGEENYKPKFSIHTNSANLSSVSKPDSEGHNNLTDTN